MVLCDADKLSSLRCERATLHNRLEQLGTKSRVPDRVAKDSAVAGDKMRYDSLRRALRNGMSTFARGNLYRNCVRF